MPERLIRPKDLYAMVGLKRTQIQNMVAGGEFPKPVKLTDAGRAIAWVESEITAWQKKRIKARKAVA